MKRARVAPEPLPVVMPSLVDTGGASSGNNMDGPGERVALQGGAGAEGNALAEERGCRQRAHDTIEAAWWQVISMVMTVFALFMFDINAALLPPSADNPVFVVMTVAFSFFIIELVMTMLAVRKFYSDLFFWLDVVATLSIIPDVPWLMDGFLTMIGQDTGGEGSDSIRAGGRVARVGARAARVVRVMRLLRLLRIFKLLRFFKKADKGAATEEAEASENALSSAVPKNVASEISSTVSRRVVLILLLVLVAANVFATFTEDHSSDLAFQLLTSATNESQLEEVRGHLLQVPPFESRLVYLSKTFETGSMGKHEVFEVFSRPPGHLAIKNDRRKSELEIFEYLSDDNPNHPKFRAEIWIDIVEKTVEEATYTLLLLVCLVAILMTSNYVLSNDAIKIVGEPLERVARSQQATEALMAAFKAISREDQSLNDVSKIMVSTAHKVLDAQVVNLYLLDDAAKELWCTHTPDDESPFMQDIRIPVGEGLVGQLALSQGTTNLSFANEHQLPPNDQSLSQPPSQLYENGWHADDVVAVAIVKNANTVGVLQVINKQAVVKNKRKRRKAVVDAGFTRTDELMLEAFAMQIAPVIARRMMDVVYTNAMSNKGSSDNNAASMLAAFATDREMDTQKERTAGRTTDKPRLKTKSKTISSVVNLDKAVISHPASSVEVGQGLPSIESLKEWGANCLDFTQDQLVGCTVMILRDVGCERANIDMTKAANFVGELYLRYNRVPYHNMYHAFSVLQGCFCLLQTETLAKFPVEEKVAMLLAACGHDVGHDGTNHSFHVGVESVLASHYNDKSILENMHAWHTFNAMRVDPDCDVLSSVGLETRKMLRRLMINAILATDMAYHKEKVDKLSDKESFDMDSQKDRGFMMEVIVHTVDIAHPAFPWVMECRWARLVASEFQAQVDRERAFGLPPTTFMECTGEQHLGKGQLGFVDYVVRPIFSLITQHVPEMKKHLALLEENRQNWADVGDGKKSMLGNEDGQDDDMMAWSVNVGCLALGPSSDLMKQTTPVTVLMSEAGKNNPEQLLNSPKVRRAAEWLDSTSGRTQSVPTGPGVWT